MSNPYQASSVNMDGDMPQTYDPSIFSVQGRLGRLRYLAYGLIINFTIAIAGGILAALVAAMAKGNVGAVIGAMVLLVYVPILANGFIMAKRRLNDLDQSGWLGLLMIVPVVNFFFGLYLLFAPGTNGSNRYGPPPTANNNVVILLVCILPMIAIIGILAAVALPAYQGYTQKAKFSEVMASTNAAKVAVEICAQDGAQGAATWSVRGCGAGSNGVPNDISTPSGFVGSVTTADNGVITATAIEGNGLHGQTFVLVPTFNEGRIFWTVTGTCKTNMPPIC